MKTIKAFIDWAKATPARKSVSFFFFFVVINTLYILLIDMDDFLQDMPKRLVMNLVISGIFSIYVYWVEKKRARSRQESEGPENEE